MLFGLIGGSLGWGLSIIIRVELGLPGFIICGDILLLFILFNETLEVVIGLSIIFLIINIAYYFLIILLLRYRSCILL